ncbi:capsular polysaccharide export protein, LipB/KpsS family [Roseicella aquatilis]|uniref:Capsular biosynthesis protein n=1 Tax=Roseicella aquatilis TaxID=2527868 RepID=A0A4R4DFU3_9PROT|nr:hypothetical protein [Roseicella aquatilis]TCZ59839.1 hypothetical protein EXY23_14645 [Roseicella aquatilis]
MTATTIVIFRMAGSESARNARDLAATVAASGATPLVVPFFWEFGDDPDSPGLPATPLFGAGIASAPRLSGHACHRHFGADLDLIDLSAQRLADQPLGLEHIDTESVWSQHLRGTALVADHFLQRVRPRAVLIPHGAEILSRLLREVAERRGLRSLFWESPFLPGFHYVEPFAPHFFAGASRLDLAWQDRQPLAPAERQAAAAFLAAWRADRVSKYAQASDPAELDAFETWCRSSPDPVLFLVGQVPSDANVLTHLGPFQDFRALRRALLAAVPAGWRVVVKHHPRDPASPDGQAPTDRVFHASSLGVHDLFARVRAVATLSSNVGLEAALAGLPVLVLGRPVYAGKGLTIDLDGVPDLTTHLARPALAPPPAERVLEFLHHLIGGGLIRQGDGALLARRIEEAPLGLPRERLSWYGPPVRSLAAAARALDDALRADIGLDAALARLPPDQRNLLAARIGEEALLTGGGAARALPPDAAGGAPRLDVAAAVRDALGGRLVEADIALDHCRDPVRALRAMRDRAGPEAGLVLQLPNAPLDPGDAVQRFRPGDIAALAEAGGWRPRIDLFGLEAGRLLASPDGRPHFVAVLRPGQAEPLSPAQRARIIGRPLRYRPWHLPAALFSVAPGGSMAQGACAIPLGATAGHVVFGPYAALPAGLWDAEFAAWLEEVTPRPAMPAPEFALDIYGAGDGEKAWQRVGLDSGAPFPVLRFEAGAQHRYEFRIFAESGAAGRTLRFGGVTLREAQDG